MTGQNVVYPGISDGNLATDTVSENEAIRKIIEKHPQITEEFRKAEFRKKLKFANKTRLKSFNHNKYKEGDKVFFQSKNSKAWSGPAEVFAQKNNEAWIRVNGDLRRINVCKLQPYDSVTEKLTEMNLKFRQVKVKILTSGKRTKMILMFRQVKVMKHPYLSSENKYILSSTINHINFMMAGT